MRFSGGVKSLAMLVASKKVCVAGKQGVRGWRGEAWRAVVARVAGCRGVKGPAMPPQGDRVHLPLGFAPYHQTSLMWIPRPCPKPGKWNLQGFLYFNKSPQRFLGPGAPGGTLPWAETVMD